MTSIAAVAITQPIAIRRSKMRNGLLALAAPPDADQHGVPTMISSGLIDWNQVAGMVDCPEEVDRAVGEVRHPKRDDIAALLVADAEQHDHRDHQEQDRDMLADDRRGASLRLGRDRAARSARAEAAAGSCNRSTRPIAMPTPAAVKPQCQP